MEDNRPSKDRFRISKFKLDSLLDITLSINANLPTEELLSKYESILRNNLGIGKILIFKHSGTWSCILNAGFPDEYESVIDDESRLLRYTEITFGNPGAGFEAIDIIIPVLNNNIPLAYVLIGDIDEEGEGMSPVLKHLNFIQTISSIIIVAIENIRLFNESLAQEAIRKELELAAKMQNMLIPDKKKLPSKCPLIVTGYYHPHYEVGGDYYDCIELSDTKTGICIADVSGKGISAAMLMSNFQASLRALFTHKIGLEELVRKLNDIIVINAAGEKFITLFIARFDKKSKMFEYVNAAHTPPVLYNTVTGEVKHLRSSCVGVGMLDIMPCIKSQTLELRDRSKLVCYTDGLSELKDNSGNDIGTKSIIEHISNTLHIETNIRSLIDELGIPSNNPNLFDDVSIIAADIY